MWKRIKKRLGLPYYLIRLRLRLQREKVDFLRQIRDADVLNVVIGSTDVLEP